MDLGYSDFQLPIADSSNSVTDRAAYLSNAMQLAIGNWQSEMFLSLRELEAFARALLPILLTFFDTRVARNQTCLFQRGTKICIVFQQRPRDAVANRSCLACRSAAANIDQNIKFSDRLSQLQGLPDDHAQGFIWKILIECFSINLKLTPASTQVNSGS
jgi:hypothetical protein